MEGERDRDTKKGQGKSGKRKLVPLDEQKMEWRPTKCFDPHIDGSRVRIARRGENTALRPGHEVSAVNSQRT